MLKRIALTFMTLGGVVACAPSYDHDVVIRGGTLFDGTGSPGIVGDLAIDGDRIVNLGRVEGRGELEIDAEGRYVAPGFTDMHSHAEDPRLLHGGHGPSMAYQGFTLEVYGETTSMGPLGGKRESDLPRELEGKWTSLGEFLDFMEGQGISANVLSYVGSGGVRANVMGHEDRVPTEHELEEMKEIIRQAMREGAFGISSGMSYVPNIYMKTDELVALVKASAEMGGIYANHARTMNGTDPEAITEAVEVAKRAGAPLHFFHLNSVASTRADEFLAIIDEARLRDPEERKRIAGDFVDEPPYLANIGWHRVRLGVDDPEVNGKLVEEVSEIRQQPPEEVFMDVVLAQGDDGIVIDCNNEEDKLRQVMSQEYVAVGTDGEAIDLEWEDLPPLVHPRHLGTAPRWLGTYVRDEKLMSWEEAIRKLAGLPASILSLEDRGTLAEGNFADVVVFDPETINGRATFEDPLHYSVGMEYVFVNGIAVVSEGEYTGELPGRALRGPAYQP